jgi:curved DNA-binding protein CbpA
LSKIAGGGPSPSALPPSGATVADVKAAYRERVKQFHPDQGGTVQDSLRVQEAYEHLLTEVF